jgi:hypothetical protein
MIIRITQCSGNLWYTSEIGSTYHVCNNTSEFYKVKTYASDEKYVGYILKTDCLIIQGTEDEILKNVLVFGCRLCGIELDKDKPWIDICDVCLEKEGKEIE